MNYRTNLYIFILCIVFSYVLYFNPINPIDSFKVCVKKCPEITILNVNMYYNYSNEIQSLCFYNVTMQNYDKNLCPPFPIFKSKPIAHR